MANSKASTPKELNLDAKVTIRNLAGWTVGFACLTTIGDIAIVANGTQRVSRNELIAQVQNGDKLLAGLDGMGSHATIYIDDEATRIELGFDSEDGSVKQKILTDDAVKALFDIKDQSTFEEQYDEVIKTRAEKYAILKIIQRLGLNDYAKIRFIEKQTGYTMP